MKYRTELFKELSEAEKLEVARQVKALVQHLNDRYEPDMPTPTVDEILTDDIVHPSLVAHRALDRGRLVGITLVRDSKLDGGRYISDVYVHPKYRRHGVAETLVNRALEDAKNRGSKSVLLSVFSKNEPASKLYEKLGFIPASMHMKKEL